MGALLLVHNRSSPSILDCIFLQRTLEMKLNSRIKSLMAA